MSAPASASGSARATGGRGARRRLWLGLLTVLGVAERGFFIPHRHAKDCARPGERPAYGAVEALFAAQESGFRTLLERLDAFAGDLLGIEGAGPKATPEPRPRWGQDWFPALDAAIAYALVRDRAPRRIVEVGSGHSTRFFARAVADGGLTTQIVAIDPAPRATLEGLGVELHRATLQELLRAGGASPFDDLGPGDTLSIDSSHVLMPGSDVDILFGRVLPALPPGVLIHIHDVFLPDDYPPAWAWRGYNEQLGILPMLLGGRFEVIFASHYVATRMTGAVSASLAARLPQGSEPGLESSLWLKSAGPGA